MPAADATRWNQRYSSEERSSFERPRPFLVANANLLPVSGLALDAAMGLGGNAGFLLERGLKVVGVDIAEIAVRIAKMQNPRLMAVIADLTAFALPPEKFDVIVNFYYLQRNLLPAYIYALKPGGILVLETLTREMAALRPDIAPKYLLDPGELRAAFTGKLEILVYREGWVNRRGRHPRAVASLVGRKNPSPLISTG